MRTDKFFTLQQQFSFLKDQAIFADSPHLRKKAVIELVQSCPEKQAAIVILSEIIDSCPDMGDGDFKQFCSCLMANIKDKELDTDAASA